VGIVQKWKANFQKRIEEHSVAKQTLKKINFPGAGQTHATGINNSKEIVGTYLHAEGNVYGFSLGKGIVSGQIAGLCVDTSGRYYGFVAKIIP
jgi:hypothetical protein